MGFTYLQQSQCPETFLPSLLPPLKDFEILEDTVKSPAENRTTWKRDAPLEIVVVKPPT